VAAANARGATVLTPATLGVGLLEFHQMDRMVQAGRDAARALLTEAGPDLSQRAATPHAPAVITLPPPREAPANSQ
jgi:hypothetical protein